jgi:riboflavin transporter FmnP
MTDQKTPGANKTTDVGRRTRWSARQIAIIGLFAAIGVMLSFVEIPIFPPAPFLKYDPSNVAGALGGIAYGPGLGTLLSILIHGIHGFFGSSGMYGTLMNIPALLAFMLPVTFLTRKAKTNARLIIGLIIGAILSTIMMILMNLAVTPHFMGVPFSAVVDMIIPILIPFNLIKVAINAVLTFALYKSLQKVL